MVSGKSVLIYRKYVYEKHIANDIVEMLLITTISIYSKVIF